MGLFLKKGSTQTGFLNRGLTLEIYPSLFAETGLALLIKGGSKRGTGEPTAVGPCRERRLRDPIGAGDSSQPA